LGTGGNVPTASRLRITRTASDITNTQNLAFGAGSTGTDYIENPNTTNEEFFVRITTFSDTAWTTTVDQGTVANSTAAQIDITAKVQETLNFSVGATPTAPTASCNALGNAPILLGLAPDGVLDFAQAYDAHSYFRVSTNANGGTIIYYSGDTLKNGANDIDAASAAGEPSTVGQEEFGLAIDPSDTVGTDGHSFTSLAPTPPYDDGAGTITDGGTATFAFDVASVTTPVSVASSAGTITCDTGSVRYIGNISTTTPPGVYNTIITYLALPTY
jgi:hypothetical protein